MPLSSQRSLGVQEFLCGLAIACRGSERDLVWGGGLLCLGAGMEQKVRLLQEIFDLDGDGKVLC